VSPVPSPIRLSYRQFATASADARAWVAARVAPGGPGPRHSYDAITRDAIYRLHDGDSATAARAYLRRRLDKATRLKSIVRKDEAEYKLVGYANWLDAEKPVVADWRVRLQYDLGHGVVLSGEVPRIDYDLGTDRYRAVLLGAEPDDWPSGPRFALLQRAVARLLGRDESLVAVATQELDGSALQTVVFPTTDLDAAEAEAVTLAADIARYYGQLSP